ncbi:hypothetical protein [Flavobacterium sp. MK4S-17]|uniref:hypothetical protein n=1 Tax=Flavobacterium sp. MK4S-17 TaxID=2543737 RepID=UPI00135789E1|nr:hypothetical protein [Flavobacterium sp. MK4S-17]
MKKFPFTPQGMAGLQNKLYQLADRELLSEAQYVAEDFLSWAAARFALDICLFEYIRSLPDSVRLQLGWCIASCISARQPFSIEDVPIELPLSGWSQFLSAGFQFNINMTASTGNFTLKLTTAAK